MLPLNGALCMSCCPAARPPLLGPLPAAGPPPPPGFVGSSAFALDYWLGAREQCSYQQAGVGVGWRLVATRVIMVDGYLAVGWL